ncbi:hypothetical protein W97_02378 [Coniosporium apollinis CBS 100218]|uniref:Glutamate carboxypeptidase II n=1 Tax=Coniosporium apollinis (strain CBS 100218) TaxID=1168221 RepID=R7YNE8_CONA1|nr:uncharacterized protein W97_02378 [Coniosporium apollinis CBS 100218]EON63151.1 hypothetical protein W97_02378 [Coniosporium apollinis CBS 100218]
MKSAFTFALAFGTTVYACQRDHSALGHSQHASRRLSRRQAAFPPTLTEQESILANSFDNNTISDWSYYYTHGDHVAGRNRSQAQWTADRWSENGFTSSLAEYHVYLNYPVSKSITLSYPNGSSYTPSLEEDVLPEDETTGYPNRIPTFHGYSFTGNATAEYVYVGRGQQVDFERLVELGVPLEGRIALAKYGGPFRGLKVKNAQNYGMIGAIIFTDPGDDGNVTEANGYAAYPDGPARNPSSVQRGSVQFLSTYPGDPTTPGYPSKEDSPRADKGVVTPSIPSIPISYEEVIPLLAALDGYGTPGNQVNRTRWVGGLNVTYSTGPAPGAVISMSNVMEDAYTPIWNAVGVINGTSQDEVLIIGNHRDAWLIGGAADPNSGSAIMIELSKAFGRLIETGWQPKRTIVLASWDAEEYGLVGSTEWMEEYIPWLTGSAVAYLNIDVGCSGPRPSLSATGDLHTIAVETMRKVIFPQGEAMNETLFDVWFAETQGVVGVLGSGSDYTSFLHRGISSLDVGSDAGPDDPVYHYHSNYDSYHWMVTYGDPGFRVHTAMGQYLTLLAYHLSTDDLLPFDIPNYAEQMQLYYDQLLAVINSTSSQLDTSELLAAIDVFETRAAEVVALQGQAQATGDAALLEVVNRKYKDFSRGFTSQGGLPDREFFQHVLFAPGLDTGYAPVTYPGITEALQAGNVTLAAEWVTKTANGILVAANILKT